MNNTANTSAPQTETFVAIGRKRGQAKYKFIVRGLTKSGAVSKSGLTASDWQCNVFTDRQRAEHRIAYLEHLNQGCRYVVLPLQVI